MHNTATDSALSALVPPPWVIARPIPSEQGLTGEIIVLAPRAERACETISRARTFYVVTGELTVTVGATNHMLAADALLTIPADRAATLRNHSAEPVKLLSLALPAPRVEWRLFLPEGAPLPAGA